jgi:hypothetical protein
MILWSSKTLEEALADGQLDSWAKVKYLMIPAVMGSLFSVPFYVVRPLYGTRAPAPNYLFSFIFALMAAYLAYWGIKRCYIANSKIDGEAFFERLAVLTVPILIRILVVATSGSIALLVVIALLRDRVPALYYRGSILFSAFNPVLAYAMFAMLTNSIQRFGKLLKTK